VNIAMIGPPYGSEFFCSQSLAVVRRGKGEKGKRGKGGETVSFSFFPFRHLPVSPFTPF
jgi:hypothetical protein